MQLEKCFGLLSIVIMTFWRLSGAGPLIDALKKSTSAKARTIAASITGPSEPVPKAFAFGLFGQSELHSTVGHIAPRRLWMKSTLITTLASIAIVVTSTFLAVGMITPVDMGIVIAVSASSIAYMKISTINVSDLLSKMYAVWIASTQVVRTIVVTITSTSAAYRLHAANILTALIHRPHVLVAIIGLKAHAPRARLRLRQTLPGMTHFGANDDGRHRATMRPQIRGMALGAT